MFILCTPAFGQSSRVLREAFEEAASRAGRKAGAQAVRETAEATSTRLLREAAESSATAAPKLSKTLTSQLDDLAGASAKAAGDVAPGRAGKPGEIAEGVANWVWKHKGSVAVGTAATAVLLQPETAIATTGDVAKTVIDTAGTQVAQPIITHAAEAVAAPLVRETARGWAWQGMVFVVGMTCLWRFARRRRGGTLSTI
jgi:hypothetical protein